MAEHEEIKQNLNKLLNKFYLNHLETLHIYYQISHLLNTNKKNEMTYFLLNKFFSDNIDKYNFNYESSIKYIERLNEYFF